MNLLPPKEKEILRHEQNKRLTVVLCTVVLISLISMLLVLYSVKFYMLADGSYYKEAVGDAKKKYETPEFLLFKDIILRHNKQLTTANAFYKNEVRSTDAIKALLEVNRPAGLYLTDIQVERQSNNTLKVSIAGLSDTRDQLLAFKSNIEASQKIKNLQFPVDNLIKPSDVNFHITFEYASPI
jgi:hypothetical protein